MDELKKIFKSKKFLNLNKDKFLVEIIQLIFPQLKNLNILNNLNETQKSIITSNDFFFMISVIIIDETDNSDYFI